MRHSCTHPREGFDASRRLCRVCTRIRSIIRKAEREQARINGHHMTLGQRIAAGLQ